MRLKFACHKRSYSVDLWRSNAHAARRFVDKRVERDTTMTAYCTTGNKGTERKCSF